MRILVVDNYDSFVFNLVQYLGQLGVEAVVWRNDDPALADLAAIAGGHDGILISPGPGTPQRAGVSMDLVRACADAATPLLGVCLGHQAIGAVFGGSVVRAAAPMHGKTSTIEHVGRGVFTGLASPIVASRYHSLIVADDGLPAELEVTARTTDDHAIMGLRHRSWPVHGVQFHPESILTGEGRRMLRNFLDGHLD